MAQSARISAKSDHIIEEIVKSTGQSKIEIIEKALEIYCHHERMRLFNEAYAKFTKEDWDEEMENRKELEGTLMDGLEND